MAECRKYGNLVPIAGLNPTVALKQPEIFSCLASYGFRGVKIHPRYSQWEPDGEALGHLFNLANQAGLVSFYCTYQFGPAAAMFQRDPLYMLAHAVALASDSRVVLVHGGGVELLRYAELVRFNSNLLLDVSLTLMKYAGSSVDWDLRYLFSHFDRRVCIGSDHPEYRHRHVAQRFSELTQGVSTHKAQNVGSSNIINFLKLNQ
jgi:predicted TIM-barrel fold metal-dependent hydrolase